MKRGWWDALPPKIKVTSSFEISKVQDIAQIALNTHRKTFRSFRKVTDGIGGHQNPRLSHK